MYFVFEACRVVVTQVTNYLLLLTFVSNQFYFHVRLFCNQGYEMECLGSFFHKIYLKKWSLSLQFLYEAVEIAQSKML